MCGFRTSRSSCLLKHRRRHMATVTMKKTDRCDHMGRHTGEKPHRCSQCSAAFYARHALTIHMRRHTGERPYACHVCDYKTARASSLKLHIMCRHTGEKPYKCGRCSAAFVTRGRLATHKRSHTTEKHHVSAAATTLLHMKDGSLSCY